jgi:hypothetical protein
VKKSHKVGFVLVALVVVGGLAVAWKRWGGGAPSCLPSTHTIQMVVISSPYPTISVPPYETVCPGDTVVWKVKNDCQSCGHNQKVHVKIDDRYRRHKASCDELPNMSDPKDCFKKDSSNKPCNPEHATIAYGTTETLGGCTVKDKNYVHDGCYKYSLKGTFDIDPEIEVQGGLPFRDDRGPEASPSPQATPSPQVSPSQ